MHVPIKKILNHGRVIGFWRRQTAELRTEGRSETLKVYIIIPRVLKNGK
jgi:hypothetical protein